MSWVQIWVHAVFSTKNRIPFLKTPEIRSEFFQHIKENAKEKDIWIDCINPDISPRDFFLSKAKIKWQRKRT